MVSVNNVEVIFGNFELFSDVNFLINKKDRIGLVGKNGAGKSTLLKIIYGIETPSSGSISYPSDIRIAYLPQQMIIQDAHRTIFEEAKLAFSELLKVQEEIDAINDKLSHDFEYNSSEHDELINRLSHLNEFIALNNLLEKDASIEKILKGLGFLTTDFNRLVSEFSGGWRMRIEIAKILLSNPDLILLDEPTNHLDIESIQWLEDYLINFQGAILLISHDRAFLDNICLRTIEINMGKIYDYKVSYSKFKKLQAERIEQQIAAFENQQKIINDTERFIERFRYKATKSNQVQSRIKYLDKLEKIEIETLDTASMHVKFPPAARSGDITIDIEELSKSYGNHKVLDNINLVIERGEKVAFVGRNGEGKTTLSKIIMNEIDYQGKCKIGHNVKIGYFAQNQDELLNPNLSVFETLDHIAVGEVRSKIRDILGAFLFSGEDIEKKVKILSGGEHSRLSLAKLLLEPYNLLVLDEPTNHLDIRSKEILKQALVNFDGTLIIVSHDRFFLDGLVNKIYEIKNKKFYEHIGSVYDFLQRKKIQSINDIEFKANISNQVKSEKNIENKQLYKEKKEIDKQKRQIKTKIEKLENEIEKLEAEINTINETISQHNENASKMQELFDLYSQYSDELKQKMVNWENAVKELEEFV